ncbi:protein CURVATURE THYLAKOID 1B, chloroplastic-like [Salvia splendens]|uniref:protein CURVATURE THYLAKOID 1B, chloroplastic-like n=1 Tax=Salvia splendens TaxID=180675 RepID=UPI001C27491E|nr:protein CURVATURE THYLAKOID 1B, chloroplastic-like [Salvia splendens]XP_042026654.1 protein CURVATURE THYLAKOID 1B, chloroplastic-like [Salvia splendens]
MASTAFTPLSLSSSSKAPRLQPAATAAAAAQCVTIPTPHLAKTTSYSRKSGRNVVAMVTGEASTEVADAASTETPEIVTKIQETWDKVEDKYAVTSLAVAGLIGLIASAGVISAIDKLPLIPGVLELVGIGYTGYFAYRNLASKSSRDALIEKIKGTYDDIIGSS